MGAAVVLFQNRSRVLPGNRVKLNPLPAEQAQGSPGKHFDPKGQGGFV